MLKNSHCNCALRSLTPAMGVVVLIRLCWNEKTNLPERAAFVKLKCAKQQVYKYDLPSAEVWSEGRSWLVSAAVPAALATTTVLQLQLTSLSAPPSKYQDYAKEDIKCVRIFVARLNLLGWSYVRASLGQVCLTFGQFCGETASSDLKLIPHTHPLFVVRWVYSEWDVFCSTFGNMVRRQS